jgi:hypothetical protein
MIENFTFYISLIRSSKEGNVASSYFVFYFILFYFSLNHKDFGAHETHRGFSHSRQTS